MCTNISLNSDMFKMGRRESAAGRRGIAPLPLSPTRFKYTLMQSVLTQLKENKPQISRIGTEKTKNQCKSVKSVAKFG